jgi:hypothetical protein
VVQYVEFEQNFEKPGFHFIERSRVGSHQALSSAMGRLNSTLVTAPTVGGERAVEQQVVGVRGEVADVQR